MSTRRGERDLPLFDLPLHGEAEVASSGDVLIDPSADASADAPADPPIDARIDIEADAVALDPLPARRDDLAVRSAPVEPVDEPAYETPSLFGPDELEPVPAPRVRPPSVDPDLRQPSAAPPPADTVDAPRWKPGEARLQDRLLGGFLDLAINLIVLGLVVLAVRLPLDVPVGWDAWPPFGLLGLVFTFLYWTVPLAFWGQTPGMAWVGHVARSVTDEPLTFGQTVLRWLGAGLTVTLLGLPLLLVLVGDRSLSDRLSESKTLEV